MTSTIICKHRTPLVNDKEMIFNIKYKSVSANSLIFYSFLLKNSNIKTSDSGDDNSVLNHNIIKGAIQIYSSPYENRLKIYSDFKSKSFVYCWFNTVTEDFYIGSTNSGKIRFQGYLSPGRVNYAIKNPNNTHGINIRLARSIIKYGYDSFVIVVLEFLDDNQSQEELIKKEQYYLDLYLPTYNLSTIAGAAIAKGTTLSLEHRTKISNSLKGREDPNGSGLRIASTKIGKLNPRYGYIPSDSEREAARIRMSNNNPMLGSGTPVFIWLEDKITLVDSYRSIYHAALLMSADKRTISKYLDSNKLYRKKYYLTSTK